MLFSGIASQMKNDKDRSMLKLLMAKVQFWNLASFSLLDLILTEIINLNGVIGTFHRPHPQKEAKPYQVRDARTFLEKAGVLRRIQ